MIRPVGILSVRVVDYLPQGIKLMSYVTKQKTSSLITGNVCMMTILTGGSLQRRINKRSNAIRYVQFKVRRSPYQLYLQYPSSMKLFVLPF